MFKKKQDKQPPKVADKIMAEPSIRKPVIPLAAESCTSIIPWW